MSYTRQTIPVALLLALLASPGLAREAAQPQGSQGLTGRVTGQSTPLAAAGVYAYRVADRSLHKVMTDAQGQFRFQDLPAGLYQVIAHKPGFVPAVVMLSRATSKAFYFLELELARQRRSPAPAAAGAEGDDFWKIRARIPSDVLREIEQAEGEDALAYSWTESRRDRVTELRGADFRTDIRATTGLEQSPDLGAGQVSGGQVGIAGRLGGVSVGLSGKFFQMSPSGGTQSPAFTTDGAQASALALDVAAGRSSRISLSSLSNRLFVRNRDSDPVDLEDYQLTWSQNLTQNSRSEIRAQYTSENNYFRHGWNDPLSIPEYSNSWKIEGAYITDLGDGNSLLAGVRYRERQGGLDGKQSLLTGDPALASIDLWSRGNHRLHPRVVVEYGLYSTLSDGSLALTPEGSLVLDLGADWKLAASASQRAYEDRRITSNFLPFLYAESDLCGEAGKECYQIELTKASPDGGHSLSLSAASRKIGETLRLYFSDEFFDRLESLYLVPGDHIPEVQLAVTRQITPQVVTKVESSLAAGGGGTFQTPDRQSYENRVRYLVTSLDTQFKSTSTGVFLALHHLTQNLDPVGSSAAQEEMEFERLRLRLSQDLGILLTAASDWTLQLNFELSRASSPYLEKQEKHVMRRILGGFAVKF